MALRGAASELSRCVQAPWGPSGSVTAQPSCGKIRMAGPQVSDAELVETFIGQSDRYTHSGLRLRDCFSRTVFDLGFRYGSVLQRSAVREPDIRQPRAMGPNRRAQKCRMSEQRPDARGIDQQDAALMLMATRSWRLMFGARGLEH